VRARAFALALLSCAPSPHVAMHAAEMTEWQARCLEQAAEKWNRILIYPVRLDGGPWTLRIVDPPGRVEHGWVGQVDRSERVIFLSPNLDERRFLSAALHELGHVSGLHHIAGPGVMNPNVGETEFSAGDFEECQRVGACELSAIDAEKMRMVSPWR
jgi:hypothetical protein